MQLWKYSCSRREAAFTADFISHFFIWAYERENFKISRHIHSTQYWKLSSGVRSLSFFRHWNSPQSCQHFQGEVEHGRSSPGGASGVQGERGSGQRLRLRSAWHTLSFLSLFPWRSHWNVLPLFLWPSIGTGHKQVWKALTSAAECHWQKKAAPWLLLTAFSEHIFSQVATLSQAWDLLLPRCFSTLWMLLCNFSPNEFERTGKVYESCVGVLIYCTEKKINDSKLCMPQSSRLFKGIRKPGGRVLCFKLCF